MLQALQMSASLDFAVGYSLINNKPECYNARSIVDLCMPCSFVYYSFINTGPHGKEESHAGTTVTRDVGHLATHHGQLSKQHTTMATVSAIYSGSIRVLMLLCSRLLSWCTCCRHVNPGHLSAGSTMKLQRK